MNPTFSETQGFNKWWHILLMTFPFILWVAYWLTQTEYNLIFIFSSLATFLVFVIWFFILKLKTTISESGIIVHFQGIPFCKRKIAWSDIQSINIEEYSPLYDYGGWGVRYSMSGKGWCYNVSGKMGIKLQYTNGKAFLIGTQKPEEAQAIINHYFKK